MEENARILHVTCNKNPNLGSILKENECATIQLKDYYISKTKMQYTHIEKVLLYYICIYYTCKKITKTSGLQFVEIVYFHVALAYV